MVNQKYIHIGVVGVGEHMIENILPALQTINNIRIKCIVSRYRTKRVELQNEHDIQYAFSSVQEMASSGKCQVVICAGAPKYQEEVIEVSIDAGLHVFVEKPTCLDVQKLQELQSKAEKKSLVIYTGYNFIHADTISLFLSTLKTKEILSQRIYYHANKPKTIMWDLDSIVQSFMYAVGIHAISIAYQILDGEFDINILHYKETDECLYMLVNCKRGKNNVLLELSNGYPYLDWGIDCITCENEVVKVRGFNQVSIEKKGSDSLNKVNTILSNSELKGGYSRTGYKTQLEELFDYINSSSILKIQNIHRRDLCVLKCVENLIKGK